MIPPPLAAIPPTVAWCVVHSLWIAPGVHGRVRSALGAYERLAYVVVAAVSLTALVWWLRGLPQHAILRFDGAPGVVRWTALAAAAALGVAGARAYDGRAFLGLRQIAARRAGRAAAPAELRRDGVLARVRHPWYGAGLLVVVFGQDVTDVGAAYRGVLLAYLLIGARLEERKLTAEFGDVYAQYRRDVPAFFPWRRPRTSAGGPVR
ncbi:MAG: methyltransferase family protein [Candidatus Krumholzibacteriia bacterium]